MSFRNPGIQLAPAEFLETFADGTKIKRRAPRMRACDEKDAKGKACVGHLKRWSGAGPELTAKYGSELYRCEKCKTIYLPNLAEQPRTGTLAW